MTEKRVTTPEPKLVCGNCGSTELDVFEWHQNGKLMISTRCLDCDDANTRRA